MKISIVTPSYNHGKYIESTIQSVLSQKGDFELEYFVIDGGSTDQTVEILQKYSNQLQWVSEKDSGQANAINKGVNLCTGDVIGWINSDDMFCEGALNRVCFAFKSYPFAEWVHGRCKIVNDYGDEIRRWHTGYKHWRAPKFNYLQLITENFINQPTVFWRQTITNQIQYAEGLLDEKLYWAFDFDLWLRLGRRSKPIYIAENQALFRWHDQSKSASGFTGQLIEDFKVAKRWASNNKKILFIKSLKTSAIIGIYHLLNITKLKNS